MKFKVAPFKPPEWSVDYPNELKRARDVVVVSIAQMMHLHGIERINLRAGVIGPRLVTSPELSLLPLQPPRVVAALQNEIARTLVAQMSAYGIMDMMIMPTEEEIESIRQRYAHLMDRDNPPGKTASELDETALKMSKENDDGTEETD